MSEHRIIHVEIPAVSGKEASQFYNGLFGWQTGAWEDSGYYMFDVGDGTGGGFNVLNTDSEIPVDPGDVLVYISTDSLEDSLTKIESLGGKTVVGRQPVGDMGAFAIFADPTGNRMGLWQSADRPS